MTEKEEPMDVYRTTVEVHAKQFTGDHVAIEDWAEDLVNRGIGQRLADRWSGGSIFWGDYRGVTVTPLDAPVQVIAGRGDWIVCHPVEGWRVYTPAEFAATYQPADLHRPIWVPTPSPLPSEVEAAARDVCAARSARRLGLEDAGEQLEHTLDSLEEAISSLDRAAAEAADV